MKYYFLFIGIFILGLTSYKSTNNEFITMKKLLPFIFTVVFQIPIK